MAMKRFRTLAVVGAFAGIVGLLALSAPQKAGAAPGASHVIVDNASLPVAGTVGISGTSDVNVTNAPTVHLAAGASVRDADNAARHPIQGVADVTTFAGQTFNCADVLFVPTGKELVIEYISSTGMLVPSGQKVLGVRIITTVGGTNIQHGLTPTFVGPINGSFDQYVAAQQTRIYADAGTNVTFCADRNSTVGNGGGSSIAFSGYLVDVP